MMRYTPYLALLGFTLLAGVTLSTAAFAHPGTHSSMSASALMEHLATSPFHLVMLMAAIGLGA